MGIDLTQLLAAVTGGAQGMAVTQQQDEQRKRQQLQDALAMATHRAAMDKVKSDAQHQQNEDYTKGIRSGVAPDAVAANGGLDVAANVAGMGMPGVSGVAPSLAVQAMRQAAPEQYSPNRYQQVSPESYVDTAQTPEAVTERAKRAAADLLAQRQKDLQASQPRNIDPLSPAGMAAQERLERIRASLRPQNVGPDGQPVGKPNAENLKNAAYLNIAEHEDPALRDMGATITSSVASHIPLIGNMILRHTDPKFQSQQLAGDRWITQWLRSTSGATITPDEMDLNRRTYIPQAGDTPETLDAKAKARRDVEQGLATMAGPASPRHGSAPAPAPRQVQHQPAKSGNVDLRGDTGGVTLPAHVQTIDEMIRAGKTDAEIKAAIKRGVH